MQNVQLIYYLGILKIITSLRILRNSVRMRAEKVMVTMFRKAVSKMQMPSTKMTVPYFPRNTWYIDWNSQRLNMLKLSSLPFCKVL